VGFHQRPSDRLRPHATREAKACESGPARISTSDPQLGSADFRVLTDDVVLANGTSLTNLTRDKNPDLFWALNGAAPNFVERRRGVNGRRRVIVVRVGDGSRGRMMRLEVVRNLSAPANLGLQATTGANSFEISGVWYGPKAEFWALTVEGES
jgi:hypothetical protein